MDRTVKGFLTFAVANMIRIGESQLSCPCNICRNGHFMDPFTGTVLAHLLRSGFMDGYTRWTLHGEEEEEDASDGDDGAPKGEAENPFDDDEPPEGGNVEHATGGGNNEEIPEHEGADPDQDTTQDVAT